MLNIYKRKKLAVITGVYWFLLSYIIAALIWWYISLQKQNELMYEYRVAELKQDDLYEQKMLSIEETKHAKTIQYIGEGFTFLIVILVGAVFVYRAVRRQIRLSVQQQNFMMAITHELKTPLAIVNLNLETLQKRKLDPGHQEKLIAGTLQEATRLNSLTNNILVASQLESGNYHIHREEINFSELIDIEAKAFTRRHPQRIIQTSITQDIFVQGEKLLLQMLCSNLIENALKYSSKEKPVQISLVENRSHCLFSIADEGEGIAVEEKKKVFDKFYRTGNEAIRKTKGTGLGLYLCKRIAKDHKGIITIQDNKPQGSIFTVTLQLS